MDERSCLLVLLEDQKNRLTMTVLTCSLRITMTYHEEHRKVKLKLKILKTVEKLMQMVLVTVVRLKGRLHPTALKAS